jgi:hypothetical protein
VVAVAQAAGGLHHSLAEGHVAHGLIGYLIVFIVLCWSLPQVSLMRPANTHGAAYQVDLAERPTSRHDDS